MVSQKKLFDEIYSMCDIFVYPSFTDTFGFAIIEAMGFGLPVVSASGHSRRELIEEGKTGFVVDNPFWRKIAITNYLEELDERVVSDLGEKTGGLVLDNELRKKMGVNCQKVIKDGKFSINYRNKRLKEIYAEALK